jgi:hypothetical protein
MTEWEQFTAVYIAAPKILIEEAILLKGGSGPGGGGRTSQRQRVWEGYTAV